MRMPPATSSTMLSSPNARSATLPDWRVAQKAMAASTRFQARPMITRMRAERWRLSRFWTMVGNFTREVLCRSCRSFAAVSGMSGKLKGNHAAESGKTPA